MRVTYLSYISKGFHLMSVKKRYNQIDNKLRFSKMYIIDVTLKM